MKTLLPTFLTAIVLGGLGNIVSAEPVTTPRYVETFDKKDATHSLTVIWSLPGVYEKMTEIAYFRSPRSKDEIGHPVGKVGTADGKNGGFSCSMSADPKADVINISLSIDWTVRPAKGSNFLQFPVQYAENQKGTIAGLSYDVSWREIKK